MKPCLLSCSHATGIILKQTTMLKHAVRCDLDGIVREEGQVCPHQKDPPPKSDRKTLCAVDGTLREDCLDCPHNQKTAEQPDMVNQPPHYRHGDIECIDAIESAVTDLTGKEAVLTGQIIKYVWQWKWKNGVEDLRKAKYYLLRLIKHLEAQNGDETSL